MKIKIESDVFDIIKRIKEIDDGYFVLYDAEKDKFELHNSKQINTYCLTCPFDNLDSRLLDCVLYSSIGNIDKIIEEIDNNNEHIENNQKKTRQNQTDYMIREIYSFYNNSSKKFDDSAFSSKWR